MNTTVLNKLEKDITVKKIPAVKVGDTVEVDLIIREGNKQRIQKFKGLVIALSGQGAGKMFTVRKISYGVGVEKKLPFYSPNISKIKVLKTEPVRRAKLFFMRDRVGKMSMRIRKGKTVLVPEEGDVNEALPEVTTEAAAE